MYSIHGMCANKRLKRAHGNCRRNIPISLLDLLSGICGQFGAESFSAREKQNGMSSVSALEGISLSEMFSLLLSDALAQCSIVF
jgi:hypothetical protein